MRGSPGDNAGAARRNPPAERDVPGQRDPQTTNKAARPRPRWQVVLVAGIAAVVPAIAVAVHVVARLGTARRHFRLLDLRRSDGGDRRLVAGAGRVTRQRFPAGAAPTAAPQRLRASVSPSPIGTRLAVTRTSSRSQSLSARIASVSGAWSSGSATAPLHSVLSNNSRPPWRSSASVGHFQIAYATTTGIGRSGS